MNWHWKSLELVCTSCILHWMLYVCMFIATVFMELYIYEMYCWTVFEIYLQEVLNLHWTLSHMFSTVTEPGILTEKYVQHILFLFRTVGAKHTSKHVNGKKKSQANFSWWEVYSIQAQVEPGFRRRSGTDQGPSAIFGYLLLLFLFPSQCDLHLVENITS